MKNKTFFMNNLRISTKLLAMALGLILVFLVTLSASLILVINIVLGSYMENQVKSNADVLEKNLQLMEKKAYAATDWFTNSPRLISALKSGNRESAVEAGRLAMKSMGFDYMVITDTTGRVFVRAHSPESYGDSIMNQVSIQKALKGERSSGLEEGAPVKFSVRAAAPLVDNGRIIGAVSLGYILSSNEFTDEQKRLLGCDVTVFDGDERIATSLTENGGKRLVGTKMEHADIINTVLKQGNNYYGKTTIRGILFYTAYMPLKGTDGSVKGMLFIGKEARVINGLIMKLFLYQNSILIAAGVLLMVLFYSITKRTILVRLSRLNKRLKDIAEGEGDLTRTLDEDGKDELAELSVNFNRFVARIRDVIAEMKKISTEMSSMSTELSSGTLVFSDNAQNQASSVEEVNATTEELSAGMEFIADMTKVQFDKLSQMVTRMSDLSAIISGMDEKTRESQRLAAGMSENARTGERSLKEMNESMKMISDSSEKVNNIVQMINDISDKINLLSLNAAIESARAGDAGRGFAVVADEISKLADETAGSIKEIDRLIKLNDSEIERGISIVGETSRNIGQIINGVESVAGMMNSITEFTRRELEARDDMIQVSEVVRVKTEEIRNATSEHLLSTQEIVRASSSINGMTQAIATAAEEMASMAEEISGMAENLKGRVDYFKV